MSLDATARQDLQQLLEEAQRRGFLGPGPVEQHIERSLALLPSMPSPADSVRALDLGSGGGVPGLVLACATPAWSWHLLDGSVTRCGWLSEAVEQLGLAVPAVVHAARAEEAARSDLRATFDLVVARGFAAPPATAECAAPFLRCGGRLVVTEPPGGAPGRWSSEGLASLGMALGASVTEPVAHQVLDQRSACPDRFPRRNGVPVKRPLW